MLQSACLALAAIAVTGCQPTRTFYFFERDDDSHYRGFATQIDYPDAEGHGVQTLPPPMLRNFEDYKFWDLSLEEAIHIALANSEVVRTLRGGIPDNTLANPDFAPTIYDPAIQQSNPGGGGGFRTPGIGGGAGPAVGLGGGVEAALSAFDADLSASMFWSRNEQPRNIGGQFGQAIFARDFQQDLGTFQAELAKTAATGSRFAVRNSTIYEWNNSPTRGVPSDWNMTWEAEARQPLLQGAGVEFNRIAGPGSSVGNYGGVVIARINTDITLADFEGQVQNHVRQVEEAYWNLYFAYRSFDAARSGRDAVLGSWRRVRSLQIAGARGGGGLEEARARQEYFAFRAQAEDALCQLYTQENRLRYLMGLPPTDGCLIRPVDEPLAAEIAFDWCQIHSEALIREVNLRRQKWQIKRSEMELIAARNFLLPRLDGVARYRWLGLGDDLIDPNGRPVTSGGPIEGTDAVSTVTQGDYQAWDLGFELSVPLGFRREWAAVRQAQLRLTRDRAVLANQELEVSHLLTEAVRNLHCQHRITETNFNRRIAAEREVAAAQAVFEVGAELGQGVSALDLLLNAQRRLSEADREYYRSLVAYSQALANVHLRKGSLLEYNNIYLAEGPWPAKAYFDAKQRARERAAGIPICYGFTTPHLVSRGAYPQHMGTPTGVAGHSPTPAEPVPAVGPTAMQRLPPVR
jgi:outer membrane protein TolC